MADYKVYVYFGDDGTFRYMYGSESVFNDIYIVSKYSKGGAQEDTVVLYENGPEIFELTVEYKKESPLSFYRWRERTHAKVIAMCDESGFHYTNEETLQAKPQLRTTSINKKRTWKDEGW